MISTPYRDTTGLWVMGDGLWVGGFYFLLLVTALLFSYGRKNRRGGGGSSGPIVAIAVRPLQCFARTVTNSRFAIIDVIPGNSDPRACSPAPRRLISLTRDGTCFHVNCVNFRRA